MHTPDSPEVREKFAALHVVASLEDDRRQQQQEEQVGVELCHSCASRTAEGGDAKSGRFAESTFGRITRLGLATPWDDCVTEKYHSTDDLRLDLSLCFRAARNHGPDWCGGAIQDVQHQPAEHPDQEVSAGLAIDVDSDSGIR